MIARIEQRQGYKNYYIIEFNIYPQQVSEKRFNELNERGLIKKIINK